MGERAILFAGNMSQAKASLHLSVIHYQVPFDRHSVRVSIG